MEYLNFEFKIEVQRKYLKEEVELLCTNIAKIVVDTLLQADEQITMKVN